MDKNKIIEAAAKLVAKGAYDKAIKEYQKVLEADPKDVRILQKMGELYQKKNDNVQAAQYFIKVAESYSADGFFLKAVALYKQVLKLNPNLLDVNMKLAELHQQLGLMSEAMAYFQTVANAYDKQGDTRSSLDTLKKMVDLDPENVASRIKLAELYAREKMEKEATQEFKRAAEYLKRNNRTDDYLRVAERISALEPDNLELARELASSYLSKGDQKHALAKLQACFKADPKDVETLNLLAQAFQGLGQTSKTVSVYKELAKIYAERNRNDDVNKIWAKIEQLDPGDPDLAARKGSSGPARPAPAPAAAPAPAPSRPVPASEPARAAPQPAAPSRAPAPAAAAPAGGGALGKDQLAKLLTETDVYVKYGLHDKALEHLRKIFGADPENLDAHEKAYNIYVAANNAAQASEQLLNVLRLCTRYGEVQRAQPYLATLLQQNPGHPEVPAFLAVLRVGGGAAPAAEETLGEDAILVDSSDEEIVVADAPPDALAPQEEDLALSAAAPESEEVFAESDSQEVIAPAQDEPLAMAEEDESLGTPADLVVADEEIEPPTGENALPPMLDEDDEPKTQINQAIPFDLLTQAATTQPGIPPRKAPEPAPAPKKEAKAPPPPAPKRAPPPPPEPVEEPIEEVVEAPSEEEPASEECDEASFFLDQGLTEEAREILETIQIAYPGHERAQELMARLEAMEAKSGSAQPEAAVTQPPMPPAVAPTPEASSDEGGNAFDLAAELADELSELGGAAEEPAPSAAGDDFQYSVDEVFSEFKKGLEKVVKPEDVDTHYDLGIAYKEMGLVDDAIGEFNVALQGCRGKKKEIDCLTMVGMLQTGKGDHQAAVDAFKQALGSEHAVGETTKAVQFELALVYEAMGKPGKALYHYNRVAKLDPKYRDVQAAISRLSGTKEEEDAIKPAAKPPGKPPAGSNGANGVHNKGGSGPGGQSGGLGSEGKPAEAGTKSRKVGYI